MIPKKIHYCWFGRGEKTKLAKKCIASWKKYCPDYEIIEWNEDNFDIASYPYAKYCLDNKKWAFLSDFVRLIVIEKEGGVYYDTDVELIKRPDPLLTSDAFFGFESDAFINTGHGFGAAANHPAVQSMIDCYEALETKEDGSYPLIVCPTLNTEALLPFGLKKDGQLQELRDGICIYPADYFNPYDDPTGRLKKTENTYSIHWYSKSWMSKKIILRSKLTKPLHRIFGANYFRERRKKKTE